QCPEVQPPSPGPVRRAREGPAGPARRVPAAPDVMSRPPAFGRGVPSPTACSSGLVQALPAVPAPALILWPSLDLLLSEKVPRGIEVLPLHARMTAVAC